MDTHIKEFSIILFVLLMAIWIYLLLIQRITPLSLGGLILVTGIVTAFLYNVEHIKKIFFKSAEYEIGAEWEKIRDDVHAKAEEVKKMGQEIAEVAAFNITHLGRLAPEDLDERLVKHRDRLDAMLKNLKSDPQKIDEIIEPINQMVIYDLAEHVVDVVEGITGKKVTEGIQLEGNKIIEQTRQFFKTYALNKTRNELTQYLKSLDCYSTEIEEKLDRYEYFLKNKKLK